uniref:SXP/RAL-2 family protein Ani s 5-like cation-binding domain-containing protein n=1 Tax=Ditylenchus dipsaci TaxID=166011 RepID=A0A915EPK8_9BILA
MSTSISSAILCLMAVLLVAVATAQEQAPPPPFLQGASPALIEEFHKMLQNSNGKTDKQIDDAVEEWINKQEQGIKTKYQSFKTEMKQHHSAADAAHKAALEKFSPEAKAADEKLSAVATNPALTAEQKGKEIEKIVNGLPAGVRAEIEKAMQG